MMYLIKKLWVDNLDSMIGEMFRITMIQHQHDAAPQKEFKKSRETLLLT